MKHIAESFTQRELLDISECNGHCLLVTKLHSCFVISVYDGDGVSKKEGSTSRLGLEKAWLSSLSCMSRESWRKTSRLHTTHTDKFSKL